MSFENAQRQALTNQALQDLMSLGLVAGGVGAGWRGLKGLLNLGNRNLRQRKPPLSMGRTIDVPYEDDDEKLAAEKQADPVTGPWKGDVSSSLMLPWFLPAALGVGGGAMYGGWKLTDKLLNSRKQQALDEDLEQARADYEAALRGRSKLGQELDRLCDNLEKQAFTLNDASGLAQGLGLTALGIGGLGSGMLAYNMTKKRRPSEVLREAKARRERARMRRTPPPIYARVSEAPDEDELEGEPLDKAAYDSPNGIPPVPVKTNVAVTTPDIAAGGQTPAPTPPGSESNHPTGPRK